MTLELTPIIWITLLTIFIGASISIVSVIKDIKKDNKISKLTYTIISLIILFTIVEFIKTKIEKENQQKDKVEVIDAINKTHDLIGVKEFPGFTITTLASIEEIKERRRKYIFDIGNNTNTNRISLYLDYNNNLVYSIFDSDGVPHTIKIPQKIYTFQYNTDYFFHCEYGDTKHFNFMRFSINNNHFESLKFKNKLNIPEELYQGDCIIGTDIEKKDFSSMTLSQYIVYSTTLTDDQKEKLMNYFDNHMKCTEDEKRQIR